MELLWKSLNAISAVIWHEYVLYIVLLVGVLFTAWSFFGQYKALTHGTAVIRGKYDDKDDPGAINHFQALSAALSATVGLGNIGGVALAIAIGGPGAVFWMWLVGLLGMALKMTEVCLTMLDRDTSNPDEPKGGPMWVAQKGFERLGLKPIGTVIGGIFVITLFVSTFTGGNMFQAWSVADVTRTSFGIPVQFTGIILTLLVGVVIIGGVKRIGAVAGRLVPFMCGLYFLAALLVVVINIADIPAMFGLIIKYAFGEAEASGAFIGGTAGFAFSKGLQRALFSSEAGQGTSPIAHSAAKTHEPVREAVVAGIEPFIDTIVVCTLTALVILSTGAWNRDAETEFAAGEIQVIAADDGGWTLSNDVMPERNADAEKWEGKWSTTSETQVFMRVDLGGDESKDTGNSVAKLQGTVSFDTESDQLKVDWATIKADVKPTLLDNGVHVEYASASLTSHAFNRVFPGFGTYLVVFASWLFALSTMISWSYYGEQGVVYMFGERGVFPYKIIYCLLILVACLGIIKTVDQLDALTTLGTGVMLWSNIPIMIIFGNRAMKAYHGYMRKLKDGEFKSEEHEPASIADVVEGKDVE